MNDWVGRAMALVAVIAGIVAGTVDVGAACLINRVGPGLVLRAIASGLLGRDAFTDGPLTPPFGLVLQWAMSIVIAAIFLVARSRIPPIARHTLAAGAAYGLVVYVVMTFVVVPVSRAYPKSHPTLPHAALDIVAMIVFGLIVAAISVAMERSGGRA